MKTLIVPILTIVLSVYFSSCGGDSAGTGQMSLSITDSPVDSADSVVVLFTGITVHRSSPKDEELTYNVSNSIDLLGLNDGKSAVLLNTVIPEGHYTWIRLMVNSPAGYITVDGTQHPLEVSSGEESGLKLNRGFDVPVGGSADFTVDFDLRKSVHLPSSGDAYVLRPTLRIVDNTMVGAIAGTVDAALITNTCAPAVYTFEGSVTPDDVDSVTPEPITSSIVEQEDSAYSYRLGFLEAGTYTIAFTCDADADDPDTDDEVVFSGTSDVIVEDNKTVAHDF